MLRWYQRKKKQVWAAAVATAAGAALAYFAYSWYMNPSDEDDDEAGDDKLHQYGSPGSAVVTENSRTSQTGSISFGNTGRSYLEQRLREQQASMQAIANEQTLPEVHSRLHRRLKEVAGVDRLTSNLRTLTRPSAPPATPTMPSSFPPTSAEHAERVTRKIALWSELRDQSFVLLVATTWLLPAVTLLIHIQLTIVGRSSYLEQICRTNHSKRSSSGASPAKRRSVSTPDVPIASLSPAQQHAFMSYGSFLLENGMQHIMPQIQSIVKHHVSGLSLGEGVSLCHLWQLLSHIHEDIDSRIMPSAWLEALLPPLVVHPTVPPPPITPPDFATVQPPSLNGASGGIIAAHTPERVQPPNNMQPSTDSPCTGASFAGPIGGTAGSGGAGLPGLHTSGQAAPRCSFPPEFRPLGLDPDGSAAVAKLVLEAREVLASEFFLGAFQSSVKWCASAVADSLQRQFVESLNPPGSPASPKRPKTPLKSPPASPLGNSTIGASESPERSVSPSENQNHGNVVTGAGESTPTNGLNGSTSTAKASPVTTQEEVESIVMKIATIVPRLSRVAEEMMTGKGAVAEAVCHLPSVRALLDATFACGPFLDFQDLR